MIPSLPIMLWAAAQAIAAPATPPTIERVAALPADARPLPTRIGGRVLRAGASTVQRQWPGTYFETGFTGSGAVFEVGPGAVNLRVTVDDGPPVMLTRPMPGFYRVGRLSAGPHRLRVDVVSESQAGPTVFGEFHAPAGVRPAPLGVRRRQIEFVGDSHTVGYANSSTKRDCTEEEVWATTDTARGIAGRLAARYGADYQVNAISGRGVVRNYAGAPLATLPRAYPRVLLDGPARYRDRSWTPDVVAVSLGTNDFSTPLKPGERWSTRDALRADFQASYAAFLRALRARHPGALLIVWATDIVDGEVEAAARGAVDRLRASGEARVAFVPVRGLTFAACHHHPDLADGRAVADALAAAIDRHPKVWRGN